MRFKDLDPSKKYTFVLYVNGEPAQQYRDSHLALADYKMLAAKFPNKEFEIRAEDCTEKTIAQTNEARIIAANGLVNVYIHGRTDKGKIVKKLVAQDFPNQQIPKLMDYLKNKYSINPHAVVYGPAKSTFEEALTFMGHACTKDCSGHKAGYKWSLDHNGAGANGPSTSFNTGTTIAQAARLARPQGGGKIAQYTSQTPNAVRKRNQRLQARAATGVDRTNLNGQV